jgi:hypothetical protein
MKLLYFCNLFIICFSSFIIQPSNSLRLKPKYNICPTYSLTPKEFYKNDIKKYLEIYPNNDNDKDNDIDKQLLNITILLLVSLKIIIQLTESLYFT